MDPFLRRGGLVSFGFHIVLLLALILGLPSRDKLPETTDAEMAMEFEAIPAPVQRAKTPAPAPPPVPVTPAPAPLPVPPPLPMPPTPPSPPIPRTASPRPPAPQAAATPQVAPPAPPAPRQARPSSTTSTASASTTSQPNPTKNPAPDSHAMENTLERLRALRQQTEPPRAVFNPPRGGAIGGGVPTGVDNAQLSAAARGAIGDRIRECWTGDKGALDFDKLSARLSITTDAAGVIRDAKILQAGSSPVARAFAERAVRAALDAQCAQLPLPPSMKGANHTFEITFKP